MHFKAAEIINNLHYFVGYFLGQLCFLIVVSHNKEDLLNMKMH